MRRRNARSAEESHPESSDVGRKHAGDGKWFIVVTGRVVGQSSGRVNPARGRDEDDLLKSVP